MSSMKFIRGASRIYTALEKTIRPDSKQANMLWALGESSDLRTRNCFTESRPFTWTQHHAFLCYHSFWTSIWIDAIALFPSVDWNSDFWNLLVGYICTRCGSNTTHREHKEQKVKFYTEDGSLRKNEVLFSLNVSSWFHCWFLSTETFVAQFCLGWG